MNKILEQRFSKKSKFKYENRNKIMLTNEERNSYNSTLLKINALSAMNDKVKVNLPFHL